MPPNAKRKGPWTGYVCSGTVATDGVAGRSVILTAAHCVYDDANKAFARNVLFIPDQTDTTGTGTDLNCSNDPMGCWAPSFGVVDVNYTATIFPNNNAWDYAFYVVSDTGAHTAGFLTGVGDALDGAAGSMGLSFSEPSHDTNDSSDFTSALGYSYDADPNFMYCAEDMTTTNGTINWWLPSCGLTGGSSGGPWVQPMSGGSGPIISVNSWGYTNSPGMAGPKFYQTSTSCVFVGQRPSLSGISRSATATPEWLSPARELRAAGRTLLRNAANAGRASRLLSIQNLCLLERRMIRLDVRSWPNAPIDKP